MNDGHLPLIDLFPVSTLAPTAREAAISRAINEPLKPIKMFANASELIREVIDAQGGGQINSALEDALRRSDIYRQWQNAMPPLKDVPLLKAYRTKKKKNNDINAIEQELLRVGEYLPMEQVLYRGGPCITDGPMSTSMNPSVAYCHAMKGSHEIAILKIAEPRSVRAFPFRTTRNQTHALEYEVLLQAGLRFKKTASFRYSGFEVSSYNVHA